VRIAWFLHLSDSILRSADGADKRSVADGTGVLYAPIEAVARTVTALLFSFCGVTAD